MADLPKEAPRRAPYKAAEVCDLAHIQPYVLRSWESEFPKLGVLRSGTRLYRQSDVEQVLRIKQLVFDEGLTLSGARRRIEEENGASLDQLPTEEFVTPEMRQRIAGVKDGLRQLLTMLGTPERAESDVAGASADAAGGDAATGENGPTTRRTARRSKSGSKKVRPIARGKGGHASARPRGRA